MNPLQPNEYPAYYQPYIASVSADVWAEFRQQEITFSTFISQIPKEKENYAYAAEKWTVKEVIGHLLDTERIMAYRALRFARNDQNELAGFEENDYVKHSNYSDRSLESLAKEFLAIRTSNLFLFNQFTEQEWSRMGQANKNAVSVRALLFILVGHINHHQRVLQERYLAS
ncbi:MAG: DinB family protein [Sphingobacteriaceae bacterium]|nr:DinB family protein [Sphingobacteriaceae bacterium]